MFFKKYKLSIILGLIILVLSALPGYKLPDLRINAGDKIGHLIAYLALAATFSAEHARVLRWSSRTDRWLIVVGLICITYGLTLEVLQGTIFYQRTFDFADIAANTLGSVLGIVLYIMFFSSLKKYERFF